MKTDKTKQKKFITLEVKDGHPFAGEEIYALSWNEAKKIAKEKDIYVTGIIPD